MSLWLIAFSCKGPWVVPVVYGAPGGRVGALFSTHKAAEERLVELGLRPQSRLLPTATASCPQPRHRLS